MNVVLLRVGIDTGSGGIHGPLFQDHSFEFLPIPEKVLTENKTNSRRTYGNTDGRFGRKFIQYFPEKLRDKCGNIAVHLDPEFETFTYGDPTRPKAGLRRLQRGDILAFYAGLQGWDCELPPALYLIGYFEVIRAGRVTEFNERELVTLFGRNAHVLNSARFQDDGSRLVLIKGGGNSRLLTKACRISEIGCDRVGKPLQVLSKEMQEVFGDFSGKISIQRSPPRWVYPALVERAARFLRSLE